MEDRRKNPARPKASGSNIPTIREYHVVQRGKRWDIMRLNAFTGAFAYELDKAIGLATYEAKRDSAFGIHSIVNGEEIDGTVRQVWPSHTCQKIGAKSYRGTVLSRAWLLHRARAWTHLAPHLPGSRSSGVELTMAHLTEDPTGDLELSVAPTTLYEVRLLHQKKSSVLFCTAQATDADAVSYALDLMARDTCYGAEVWCGMRLVRQL